MSEGPKRLCPAADEFARRLNRELWGQEDEPSWDQMCAAAKKNIERTEVRVEVQPTQLGQLPSQDRDAT